MLLAALVASTIDHPCRGVPLLLSGRRSPSPQVDSTRRRLPAGSGRRRRRRGLVGDRQRRWAGGVPGEEMLVLTDRDSEAGAPVPVAVNVTLCALPSHGTGILPAPVTGEARRGRQRLPVDGEVHRLRILRHPGRRHLDRGAAARDVVEQVEPADRRRRAGGGLFEVFTCRAMLTRPPGPDANSVDQVLAAVAWHRHVADTADGVARTGARPADRRPGTSPSAH